MNRKRWRRWLIACFAVATSALSTNTSASTQVSPSSYAALVGTSRDDAEKNLGKLGFKKKKPAGDGHGSLWWNGSTKECVELQGKSGRVKSIVPTSESRCQ